MIILQCGDTVRYVNDLYIVPGKGLNCIYAMVNGGHDDLFDLGFSVEELSSQPLFINFDQDKDE